MYVLSFPDGPLIIRSMPESASGAPLPAGNYIPVLFLVPNWPLRQLEAPCHERRKVPK